MAFFISYQAEGRIYAAYILKNKPDAKIGVLYQNDDFGKDYLKGVVDGLGGKAASMIKAKATYETTDATVDSQIIELQAAGCDVLVTVAIPKFGAQAIRKVAEIGWKPLHILNGIASSVGATLKPAGFENAKGIISDNSFKDPTDPQWLNDAGYKEWLSFMDKYYPNGDKTDQPDRLRLLDRPDDRADAEAVRRRPDARERDEAGSQPAYLALPMLAAGHRGQHQRHQLRADPASPDAALQRRALRSIRSSPERRDRLTRAGGRYIATAGASSMLWAHDRLVAEMQAGFSPTMSG